MVNRGRAEGEREGEGERETERGGETRGGAPSPRVPASDHEVRPSVRPTLG